jgi:hypothetical protein
MANALRADEEFVIRAVAALESGTWSPGDNPPDAYLKTGERTIAVEISTLMQNVTGEHGGMHARLSDDMPALALANQLNEELRDAIPKGRMVVLTLRAPLLEVRKTRERLKEKILQLVAAAGSDTTDVEEIICGNEIGVQIASFEDAEQRKVHAAIANRNSKPHILANASAILEERITTKAAKCGSLSFEGPLWLALFNDYWLADVETYRQAHATISVSHPFEKILLISGDASVAILYGDS